jgi:hypothetical protein
VIGSTRLLLVLVGCRSRLQFKTAWCCQHVCTFRYADDMLPARHSPGSTGCRSARRFPARSRQRLDSHTDQDMEILIEVGAERSNYEIASRL